MNASTASWLNFFKPDTLAPLAAIIGILQIMLFRFRSSDNLGEISMGFSILFTGLLSMPAREELSIAFDAVRQIVAYSHRAITELDTDAARRIEPLEEVVDDLVATLRRNHIQRLHGGICTTSSGLQFLDVLTTLERLSDQCSNLGLFTLSLQDHQVMESLHNYARYLHSGKDSFFNEAYAANHQLYFGRLKGVQAESANSL